MKSYYNLAQKQDYIKRNLDIGLCRNGCGRPLEMDKTRCSICLDNANKTSKKNMKKLRRKALIIVGKGNIVCSCGCGCDDERFIEINHKKGGVCST